MAGSTKAAKIGVICEEKNDLEVLYQYTIKIIQENRFTFMPFVAHGCGTLRRKCRAWAQNLRDRGCELLVVMHDSDGKDAAAIRRNLQKDIDSVGFRMAVVLIPTQELEAWLLADAEAIKSVFNMQLLPRIKADTESIKSPKEHLEELVEKQSKSQYYNTIHNKKLAAKQELKTLKRCPSFQKYPQFLKDARI